MNRFRSSLRRLALLSLFAMVAVACEPTPAYLERWANRDGSEEMFAGYLHDPEVSHEVHVKALELLLDQWSYSSGMFVGGQVLRDMPDAAERDATIRDALPHLQARFANEETHGAARDALFMVRQGTDDPALRGQIDDMLLSYVNDTWNPCVETGTLVNPSQIMTMLGRERVEPRLARTISEGEFTDVLCQIRNLRNVEWLPQSEALATAFVNRWQSGNLSDQPQWNYEVLEHMIQFRDLDVMRNWMFETAALDDVDPNHKNLILTVLRDNPREDDIDRYVGMLTNTSYTRWSAFKTIVDRQGSAGLELALTSLPADSEYGFFEGSVQENGFKRVAEDVVCSITKLGELGDNARQVFERHVSSANPYTQALSITCLKRYGDAQTITTLTEYRGTLGSDPIAVPRFGGQSLQELLDEAVAAIQERVGG